MKKIFSALLCCAFALSAQAQTNYVKNNSPYSVYGLGDLLNGANVANMQAQGSLGATYNSYFSANWVNPSSLASLRYTAFEVGARYERAKMTEASTEKSAIRNDGGLSSVSLAFPINRSWRRDDDTLLHRPAIQWGMGFALTPHSTVAYDIQTTTDIDTIGNVLTSFAGNGTHYQVQWGNAIKYKNLSLGLSLAYFFGRSDRKTTTTFTADPNFVNYHVNLFKDKQNLRSLNFNFGGQYDFLLDKQDSREEDAIYERRKKRHVILGAYVGGGTDISIRSNQQLERYNAYHGTDTLVRSLDTTLHTAMPLTYGFGLSYSKEYSYNVGFNVEMQNWTGYSTDTRNAYKVSLGGEYTPDFFSNNILKRLQYRAGAFYQTDYRKAASDVAGTEVNLRRYGIDFGIGFPILPTRGKADYVRRTFAFVNTAFEIGTFGDSKAIKENYFMLKLNFTFNDENWFVRPKYR